MTEDMIEKKLAHYKKLQQRLDDAFEAGIIPLDVWEEKSEQYEESIADYETMRARARRADEGKAPAATSPKGVPYIFW